MISRSRFTWNIKHIAPFVVLLSFIYLMVSHTPSRVLVDGEWKIFATLGFIGLWRYGWWMVHFVRAQLFRTLVFSRRRKRADKLWAEGWRPKKLYFMMTTFKEERSVTESVMAAIIHEVRQVGVPTKIFVGSGHYSDEHIIQTYADKYARDLDLEVIIVRQNKPGKRFAIGLTLRAMSRYGVGGDDPVVFIDGDSIMVPGCLQKCLPFFELDREVQALTTDEIVQVKQGPSWVKAWLNMRFAQRHLAMQSHGLFDKVLTLTGRLSIFRAVNVVKHDFIRTVETDHLNHWLWHQFRFLSGDDKSTWYWLLQHGGKLCYVPDAEVITVERIEGNGRERMLQNLLRWSGNVLRNGTRASALGPRRLGFFTWWCILDQRIAMWTTLVGPLSALLGAIFVHPSVLVLYLSWVLITRTFLSVLLFPYAGRVHVSFPFFLFINQMANSMIKVYLIFRLPKQRWMNRDNQIAASGSGVKLSFRNYMAGYLTVFWLGILTFSLMIYLGLIEPLKFIY